MSVHKQKVHKYYYDKSTGERVIETPSPYCRFCFKEFKKGDDVYFADKEHFIVCKDCLTTEGQVSIFHDRRNNAYLIGSLRVTNEVEK